MSEVSSQKISLALGSGKKGSRAAPTNGLKRPHSALHGDFDEEDSKHTPQAVSHFDRKAGGAIAVNQPKVKGPLVITALKNRDWKEASKQKRQRSALPGSEQQASRTADLEEAERKESTKGFGLTLTKRAENGDDGHREEEQGSQGEDKQSAPQNADERALNALLGNKEASTLVVPAITETDAFQNDYRAAPDMATLEDYARVPVEEFGAAMLRGMGWKGGETIDSGKGAKAKKSAMPERRPALLGIGAKADAAVSVELGGWGKAARGKDTIYNPLLLKNKKTGEKFTEEELQKQTEKARLQQYEQEFEERESSKRKHSDRHSDRRSKDDDRRRDRRRGYSRDRRDDARHRTRDATRDRNGDSKSGRSRHDRDGTGRSRHDRDGTSSRKHDDDRGSDDQRRDDNYDDHARHRREKHRRDDGHRSTTDRRDLSRDRHRSRQH